MSKIKIGKRKEAELKKLCDDTVGMFDQVHKMIEMSQIMLESQDNEIALDLIDEDKYLDDLQTELIISINNFILREQPKAKDLRITLGVFAISYDCERLGDYMKSFAKITIKTKITKEVHISIINNLLKVILQRLKETKEAFIVGSHDLAKSIAKRDIEIDDLAKRLTYDLTEDICKLQTQQEAEDLRRIILQAKAFERAGDHLVNICEQISYIEKGQLFHYS